MILYFSGTGNTKAVAEALASALDDSIVKMDVAGVARGLCPEVDVSGHKRVIWCFPVYSWGVPPVVATFIKSVNIKGGNEALHCMVCTCGDDTGLTDRQWQKLIGNRGWRTGTASSIQMPNTYVTMKGFDVDSPELACNKLATFPSAVKEAVACIEQNRPGQMIRGNFAWFKSKIIYPWFIRHAMSPKPFRHNAACISCGACMKVCPMKNITPDKIKQPVWGDICAFCLACYHVCPRHAVMYGNSTSDKGQYPGPDGVKCPADQSKG